MSGEIKERNKMTPGGENPDSGCSCSGKPKECACASGEKPYWIDGTVKTAGGDVPHVPAELVFADHVGTFKVRANIGRMGYKVEPGLYAVGAPNAVSPVLVSANYKMSFDVLRSKLAGRGAWILVIDTKGINVWCAAGKGTFGTAEIVRRVAETQLSKVVSHRTLVVPQLGAPGVSAHEVKRGCGFRVVYGPVRAADLSAFLDAGMKATPEMRRVHFGFRDRVVLIPVEFSMGLKYMLIAAVVFLVFSELYRGGYSPGRVAGVGSVSAALCIAAFLGGIVLTPALLPWLPGRAFSVKGAWAGFALAAIFEVVAYWHPALSGGRLADAAWLLIIPAASSFTGMNFTGASTYTSISGVKREMSIALPVQGVAAGAGLILWIAGRFV